MKHRSPLAVALLPLVTFGLYSLFWLKDTAQELRAKGYKVPAFWILLAPVAGLMLLALLNIAGMLTSDSIGVLRGVTSVLNLLLGAVCFIAIVPVALYWYYSYAKAVHNLTAGKMSDVMTMLLIYFLGSIGMAIVQDTFNKLPEVQPAGTATAAPAVATPTVTAPSQPPTEMPPNPPTVQPPTNIQGGNS